MRSLTLSALAVLALVASVGCSGRTDPQATVEAEVSERVSAELAAREPTQTPLIAPGPTVTPHQQVPSAASTATANPTATGPQESVVSSALSVPAHAKYPVWAQNCSGGGSLQFANSPLDLQSISHIQPYGLVVGGHVTPVDHMYIGIKDPSLGRDAYEVRAIQDGHIFDIHRRDISAETNQAQKSDWRVDIGHTCTFVSYLDLMTSVIPEIEAAWDATKAGQTGPWDGIPVKAGQIIGYIGEHPLDFGVYDHWITLPGFVNPSAYFEREPWKVHTVDPFPYFPSGIREALLAKSIRTAEPRAGKIDYDIPGAFPGNWFELDTDWYNGVNQRKYWEGHLSIAPNAIDPSVWVIAVGHLDTDDNNFVMLGDADPANPAVGLAPARYEIKQYMAYIPAKPNLQWWNEPSVEGEIFGVKLFPGTPGTVLLEMLEPGLLKAEVFLNKSSDEVTEFTDSARLYSR
ncbi:MAG: hypothetical protein QF756_09785 [Dehalococcoidia bacterium]|jgi:hypothetical protein|nr:hypothetical protein [Dehalococcoidia bacterium]MDP7161533.1 hypothetical protein [Dehalococcoidia bacterium]MDP7213190.1 hypothetical protein [Dehalococcoidia bacterium]MDP7513566.1 hypothetical protein [Dehalococcoidia bacterium]|tara:strand:- start:563 stop:1942 length:1380 start_codon:yes stop_codon:yes gene_type:complete